jgi:hypothetical protein
MTGNVVSNATGGFVSGTSTALESLEPSFYQDLNGDGVIGIPSATSPLAIIAGAAGSSANDTFAFLPAASGPVPANGNEPAAFWSDPGVGHEQALFQTAYSGHNETVEAGNHDAQWTLHGLTGLTHGFIIH